MMQITKIPTTAPENVDKSISAVILKPIEYSQLQTSKKMISFRQKVINEVNLMKSIEM